MRCKVCELTTKYAGKPSRDRQICGCCWYSVKNIIKTIKKEYINIKKY